MGLRQKHTWQKVNCRLRCPLLNVVSQQTQELLSTASSSSSQSKGRPCKKEVWGNCTTLGINVQRSHVGKFSSTKRMHAATIRQGCIYACHSQASHLNRAEVLIDYPTLLCGIRVVLHKNKKIITSMSPMSLRRSAAACWTRKE